MLLEPSDVPVPDLKIAVPTAGRPGAVRVEKMLPPGSFVAVVPENELGAYREQQPGVEFLAHPMEVSKLPLKRQWICDTLGSCLQLDDDLEAVIHCEHAQGEPQCRLSPEDAVEAFRRTAWEAAQMGCYLFGYGEPDVRNFEALRPVRLAGYISGGSMGILAGSRLKFTAEVLAKDDYWISLLNAYEHRLAYLDFRYSPTSLHGGAVFVSTGGMGHQRTMASEEKDYRTLRRYFGPAIVRKKSTFRAKIKHEWQTTMVLPFTGASGDPGPG